MGLRKTALSLIAVLFGVTAGCGGKDSQAPTAPSAPAQPGLAITCPADQDISTKNVSMPVTWSAPTVENDSGNTVAVTCSPSSGSNFETGTTSVKCQAEDILLNSASCSFEVTITKLDPLTITCPPDQDVLGSSTLTAITWNEPTTEGAFKQVTVSCLPSSGSDFSLGTTAVQCEAQDATDRTASCSFGVTVKVPRITKTKLVAFGDSYTEGFLRDRPETFVVDSLTYPSQLEDLLSAKYPAQDIIVVNAGLGGESAAQGRDRISGVLNREQPGVVIILEGSNLIDLTPADDIASDIRSMARSAQVRDISPILATLMPVTPAKEVNEPGRTSHIRTVNGKIRTVAAQLGVTLVDLYALMDGKWHLFGSDGSHPNPDGYRFMAEAFFEAIVSNLDGPPALLPYELTKRVVNGGR